MMPTEIETPPLPSTFHRLRFAGGYRCVVAILNPGFETRSSLTTFDTYNNRLPALFIPIPDFYVSGGFHSKPKIAAVLISLSLGM